MSESTHNNGKLYLCILMLVLLFLCSYFRGKGTTPSVVGVTKCSPADYAILISLIVIGILISTIGAFWVQNQNKQKIACGHKFVQGEMDMTVWASLKIGFIGLIAGFLNAGFGVGSTFMINSQLVRMGIPPLVSGNTGIFCALVNNISSTIAQLIYKKLNLVYALMIVIPTLAGAVPGIYLQHYFIKCSGRSSVTVVIMIFFIVFSVIANPTISIIGIV